MLIVQLRHICIYQINDNMNFIRIGKENSNTTLLGYFINL